MARTIETGIVNGCHRASISRENGTLFYAESNDLDSAVCWLDTAETLRRTEALPQGVTLGWSGRRRIQFRREIPFGFDFQWVREVALDVLRGATGFRLDGGVNANVAAEIGAPFDIRVSMVDDRLRLRLNSSAARSGGLELKATAQVISKLSEAPAGDPLLAALAGIHPLEWVRNMLNAKGSSLWRDLASASEAPTWALERIHAGWREMSVCAEAAVWRALGDDAELDNLLGIVRAAASGSTVTPEPGSAAAEWVDAISPGEATGAARSLLTWLGRSHVLQAAAKLRRYAQVVLDPMRPADWAAMVLAEQAGCRPVSIDPAALIQRWRGLRDSIYAAAAEALNRRLAAELTAGLEASTGESAVIDVSFPAIPEGAAALRLASSGDIDSIFTRGSLAEVHSGLLSDFHTRRRYLDLHLPFLGRKQYWHALDSIASASAVNEGVGRIAVYSLQARDRAYQAGLAASVSSRDGLAQCDNVKLSFEHRFASSSCFCDPAWARVLDAYGVMPQRWPADASEAILTISAPAIQVLAWTSTPHPSTPEFASAVSHMSTSLQLLMRRWLPALYFADPRRFENLAAAWPLLVYSAGLPCQDTRRNHYTYDAMDPESVAAAACSASASLPALMEDVQRRLSAAGLTKKIGHYVPYRFEGLIHKAIRSPQFALLLRADAFLVLDMVRLAETGREFRTLWSKQPRSVIRRLSKDGAYFVRSFNSRLKRLFGGSEFLALGPLVLAEATAALAGGSSRCEARLEFVGADGARIFFSN